MRGKVNIIAVNPITGNSPNLFKPKKEFTDQTQNPPKKFIYFFGQRRAADICKPDCATFNFKVCKRNIYFKCSSAKVLL